MSLALAPTMAMVLTLRRMDLIKLSGYCGSITPSPPVGGEGRGEGDFPVGISASPEHHLCWSGTLYSRTVTREIRVLSNRRHVPGHRQIDRHVDRHRVRPP